MRELFGAHVNSYSVNCETEAGGCFWTSPAGHRGSSGPGLWSCPLPAQKLDLVCAPELEGRETAAQAGLPGVINRPKIKLSD